MHVVVVVEGVEKIQDFLAMGLGDFREILGDISKFGGDHIDDVRHALEGYRERIGWSSL